MMEADYATLMAFLSSHLSHAEWETLTECAIAGIDAPYAIAQKVASLILTYYSGQQE